jgi:SpoVK/Ycf46/Vps4 family AAA+-type ATPase
VCDNSVSAYCYVLAAISNIFTLNCAFRVRKEILDVLELPFKHPGLFHAGSPRRQGVLLYGPPGTQRIMADITDVVAERSLNDI